MKKKRLIALTLLVMKISIVQLALALLFVFSLSAKDLTAQVILSKTFSLSVEKTEITKVLTQIQQQTGAKFVYSSKAIDAGRKISYSSAGKTVGQFLDEFLKSLEIGYKILDDRILLFKNKIVMENWEKTEPEHLIPKKIIVGKITSSDGKPLEGASVKIKGSNRGTMTDSSGKFKITVTGDDKILVISFTGYSTTEITIGDKTSINISLAVLSENLEDVIVVGYGTQKRSNVTGAVTALVTKDLVKSSEQDLNNQLTGRAPGIRIVQNSSQPGQFDSQIDIRGFSTESTTDYNGTETGGPLFVIDGVPRDQQTFQMLDPNEIASVSVLKDATASIYGVEAANGVILVTTKKGANRPVTVNYTGQYGRQYITKYPSLSNAYQYATLYDENQINQALSSNQQQPAVMYSQQQIEDWRTGKLPSTDWLGAIVNNSSSQTQHNINISGGSQKFQFFLSGGYFNQGGLLSSGMEEGKKYNLRADVGAEIAKGLKFDVNLGLIDNVQNQPSQSVSNIIRNTWRFAPAYPVYSNNAPGYYNHVPNEQNPNPVALIDQNASGYNYQNSRNFQSTFTLDYQIPFVEGLSAKALFAYDNSYFMNKHFTKAFSEYDYDSAAGIQVPDAGFNGPSNLHQSFGEGIRNDLQFQLNYSKSFGKHNLSILALYEELYNQSDGIEGQGNYVIDALDQLSAIDPSTALNTSSYGANSNRSYAGKLNYGYAGKYLLEAGFREEGSSYFSGNRRWGFFPYASAGWVISNESFIKNNLKFINNLKLRASIGKEGDDQGAAASFPAFMEGYNYPGGNSVYGANGSYQGSVFGSNFVRGISFKNSVNPNITWYTSTQTDIGLDLSFWEGKLTFTGDIFRRNRSGLLATPIIAVPGTYGVNLPPENINSDRTEGFEIELGTTGKIGNVTYTINPNMSFARTEWLHYEQSSPLNAQSNYTGQLSHRWTDLVWGYKVIGQFQNYDQMYAAPDQDGAGNKTLLPGDYKYADVNHDGQINSADETVIASGGVKPLIYFATNINLTWKEFDFSLLLQGATMFHHTFQDQLSAPFYFTDSDPVSIYFDRWHQENMLDPNSPWVPGRFPSTGERSSSVPGNTPNSANTYNATYLRIKSLEIGYTFRGVTLKRLQFKALRVFANAYDLYTFTGKGLNFIDPEYSSTRYFGSYEYPITMNVNIGAQLTF